VTLGDSACQWVTVGDIGLQWVTWVIVGQECEEELRILVNDERVGLRFLFMYFSWSMIWTDSVKDSELDFLNFCENV
jgi:hypothetical protein